MSHNRLSLAVEEHGLSLPEEGRLAVFAPRVGYDLSLLPRERCDVIQPFKPDFDAFEAAGYAAKVAEETGAYSAAIVVVPRAKAQARDLIARAAQVADIVIVDGQKTDGVDSLYKECRKRGEVLGSFAKAHGRLFWFSGGDFEEWRAGPARQIDEGFETRPGVFSADGIDPASQLLIASLPNKLGRVVADLGAGWGFLSRHVTARDGVEVMHLVEADHVALECARANVKDARAQFHWSDATNFKPGHRVDTVVMNPPFHTGRKAEPDLGKAFILAAAKMLAPSGQLFMVANRHLPYEATLREAFQQVEEVAGDTRFKVLQAQRPSRTRG
ncbi:class I SAM-dependent methyltransferase [Shimia sp. R11_0]|uniref:class I SAM-dependent methyltransferase n=1 Tax=Shimia sp. R11_0 TaxID=2821096 RepID=UPI001ADC2711|nr:class I SAM-dependent methyltransferase [Shimia sp. R11_0]MBO9478851.1 class I SAM-dependent methyltransferase [Shimia sp. R11_0]